MSSMEEPGPAVGHHGEAGEPTAMARDRQPTAEGRGQLEDAQHL